MVERRKFYRARENSTLVLYPAGEGIVCPIENISSGGLCFKSSKDVIRGPDIKGEITLSNPRLKSTLRVPAHLKPVWSKKTGERFKVGAEFIDMSGQDKEFILKRIDNIVERQKLRARWKDFIRYFLLMIAILGGAALFIFQQRTFFSVQDSLKTALSYSEKNRLKLKSDLEALQSEFNDTKSFLIQTKGLLKSDRIKFNSEIAKLKRSITTLNNEVMILSNKNTAMETKLHDLKELRLAVREVKREIHLKRARMQEEKDRLESLAGNKGYIIRNSESTSGTKDVKIDVLPAETRGVSNWE